MELFTAGIGVLVAGGVLAVAGDKRPAWASAIGGASAVLGGLLAAANALVVLAAGRPAGLDVPWQVPLGRLALGLDALSAVFVLPIGLIVAVAAVYGTQYLGGPHGPRRLGLPWLGFNLLAAAMLIVVTARNGLLFLMAWEAMAVTSFLLVTFQDERLTSHVAEGRIGPMPRGRAGGPPTRAQRDAYRARVDREAAAIILQDALDTRRAGGASRLGPPTTMEMPS